MEPSFPFKKSSYNALIVSFDTLFHWNRSNCIQNLKFLK